MRFNSPQTVHLIGSGLKAIYFLIGVFIALFCLDFFTNKVYVFSAAVASIAAAHVLHNQVGCFFGKERLSFFESKPTMEIAAFGKIFSDKHQHQIGDLIMSIQLSPDDLKLIESLRSLQRRTVLTGNLVSKPKDETEEPTELQKIYFAKKQIYDDARSEFNTRRIEALSATDSTIIHDWAKNANIYSSRAQAAMADWVKNGYKQDYEMIAILIEKISQGRNSDDKGENADIEKINAFIEKISSIEMELTKR